MASVANDPNGYKRVCFTGGDGEPKAIHLGKCGVKAAESFKLRVETLLQDLELNRAHDAELCAWLNALSEKMHKRLAGKGLVEPRAAAVVVTLGMLLDRFDAAAAVQAGTRTTYLQAMGMLREHLGESTPLGSITPAHADGWRKAIAEPKPNPANKDEPAKVLAPATVAKRVRVAKAVFRKAVKWALIPSSPFADLRAGSMSNPDRAFYVAPESIRAILAACPDDEWRAIVALSRFAGLRCPSEVVGLRWGDVNWERGRLTVRSPKTAGHEGHAVRVVPIAPDLRPILQDLFDRAEPGTVAVVPRLHDPRLNLRTTFAKIIARAGVKPWPRMFHNMRASCATDWVERFPAHVVAGWLGHSPLIAAQHYLQTRDAHFDLATAGVSLPGTDDEKSGAQSGAPGARKAAQHPTAPDRTDSPEGEEDACFAGVSQADAGGCEAAAMLTNDPDGIRTHVASVKGMCPGPG